MLPTRQVPPKPATTAPRKRCGRFSRCGTRLQDRARPTLAAAATSSPDAPDRLRAALRETKDSQWLLTDSTSSGLESEVIIPQAVDALASHDLRRFGDLVDESQAAAETLLGNQVPETMWLARRARELGAYAASAFGAGFGGSVWALVSREDAMEFARRWREDYEHRPHTAARASDFLSQWPDRR